MIQQQQFVHALIGASLILSALACSGPPHRENEAVRRGEDILISGSAPESADSVPGDAMLAGGDIRFSGATGGDYLGAGGSQVIQGRIHGAVRAAGGDVRVTAIVDRNATVAGGRVTVDRDAVINRSAYLAGGTVQVAGNVRQGVYIIGNKVGIDGPINGDVEVVGGALWIGPRAVITGNLRYRVPRERVRIDPAARIAGTRTALPVREFRGPARVFGVLWLLGFLVAGAIAVALLPRVTTSAVELMRARPGISALVGFAYAVLTPIAALIAVGTIIGIPLAFIIMAIYFVLMYLGRTVLAVWLGDKILRARSGPGRSGSLANFFVGGVILVFLEAIPGLGTFILFIATILGVGALVRWAWERWSTPVPVLTPIVDAR